MLHRNNNYTVANLETISNLYWKLETIIENIEFRLQILIYFHKMCCMMEYYCVYIIMKSDNSSLNITFRKDQIEFLEKK